MKMWFLALLSKIGTPAILFHVSPLEAYIFFISLKEIHIFASSCVCAFHCAGRYMKYQNRFQWACSRALNLMYFMHLKNQFYQIFEIDDDIPLLSLSMESLSNGPQVLFTHHNRIFIFYRKWWIIAFVFLRWWIKNWGVIHLDMQD